MDNRTNNEWIADLQADGDQQAQALEDLRGIIAESLPTMLSGRLSLEPLEIEAFVKSITQKTLSHVLENLNTFEGRSAFTTWVLKIGVRQTLGDVRWLRWQAIASGESLPAVPAKMYDALGHNEFMQYVHRVFREELTDNQRFAIRAMIMLRMPKEEVAKSLGMERCDYFRMIHDARLRLKRRLAADGWFTANSNSQK